MVGSVGGAAAGARGRPGGSRRHHGARGRPSGRSFGPRPRLCRHRGEVLPAGRCPWPERARQARGGPPWTGCGSSSAGRDGDAGAFIAALDAVSELVDGLPDRLGLARPLTPRPNGWGPYPPGDRVGLRAVAVFAARRGVSRAARIGSRGDRGRRLLALSHPDKEWACDEDRRRRCDDHPRDHRQGKTPHRRAAPDRHGYERGKRDA